jgi:hypothetical protein
MNRELLFTNAPVAAQVPPEAYADTRAMGGAPQ